MHHLILAAALTLLGEEYTLGPDSQPRPDVPKGAVTRHVLAPGKFFPGTPHSYAIYVPKQYDGSKPVPFMVFLDGSGALGDGQRVPVVFDNLIAKGDLPPMIGIFVDPGVLPAASDQAQSRFERVFEYDSLSDRFARFLVEELIAEVGKSYKLSSDPNDHGISGVSTGAVGAFAAAWNRPDQFRRVLSFIGTFVAMKGADTLPALIRRTEPKPIRIFLQAGRNDHITPNQPWGTFFAGSWPINNQVMQEAFQFAGYDSKLVLGDEAHNMKHGAAILPEALRWLWRGYPQPITVREPAGMGQAGWDPRGKVYSTVWADKPFTQVGDRAAVAGPAPDPQGNVYFADAQRIYKADAEGKISVFREAPGVRALRVGADGRLYASQPGRKRIVSYGAGGQEKTVASGMEASDLAVTGKGGVYFADPSRRVVGYVDPAGKVRTVATSGAEMALPTGVGLSPDQAMLIVADAQSRFSWSFQIAADGSLINGEPFYRLEMPEAGWMSGAQGAAEDTIGQVYFATALGVQVCEANGRTAQILNPPAPGGVTGLAFGGKERNRLYVVSGGKMFQRPVKVTGAAVWNTAKPPRPPL